MARNEEKQQGKLNRLWLQKEREEGRLRDALERRPKLQLVSEPCPPQSTLHSASSVTKWIPSIKNEIEYYLQQSQLSHYPERKIAEFQLHIEALEKEYKRFIAKLRALDPSRKHQPWTPRGYSKRRAETQDSHGTVKNPRRSESREDSSQWSGADTGLASSRTGCHQTSAAKREGPLRYSVAGRQTPVPAHPRSETSETARGDQDQPLSFDRTRLAVATAACRGPSVQLSSSQTHSLVRVLQSGLPNLTNSPSGQIFSSHNREAERDVGTTEGEAAERIPERSSCTAEERIAHVLGLDCYSSSDGECDT